MELNLLYYIGIILLTGLVFGKLVTYLKLPHVTGYLIGGIIIGPSLLNIVPHEAASSFGIITEAALGFIAFSIGSEFEINQLKKTGFGVVIITVLEALFAVACVDLAMIFLFKKSIQFSLILGAIAAATAPAATVMVIRQYKAKGPLVDTLLQVVAMDDAVGIIAFSISLALSQAMTGSNSTSLLKQAVLTPAVEILGAAILGLVSGIVLSFFAKKASGEDQLLAMIVATILFTVGVALRFKFSTLIACMILGATVVNLLHSKRIFSTADRFTSPIFIAFFTIAGVDLNLGIVKSVGLIGIGYVLFRVVGKLLGAFTGARLAHSPEPVQKYLGFALIPQAGVAIGLSMVAERALPGEMGLAIKTIILGATVIYELFGPVIAKMAISKAGEIKEENVLGAVQMSEGA